MSTNSLVMPEGRTERLSRLRRTIATRMVESLQVAAQLTTVMEVDYRYVDASRRATKESVLRDHGIKLSFLPFIAAAALEALAHHASINASVDMEHGEATYYETKNLAVAVDTERGLLAPVVRNADALSVVGLAKSIAEIAQRTRDGLITPDELAGGTFTITNTGSRGALFDTPIVNQPQVAILGAGAIVERPVVRRDGDRSSIEISPMGYLALSYDHRLVDGADAARYLTDVKTRLESESWCTSLTDVPVDHMTTRG